MTARVAALAPFEPPAHLAVLRATDPQACFAAEEFFTARIRNPHTRKAYAVPVRGFLRWLDTQEVPLVQTTPGHAAHFLDADGGSIPTRKLAIPSRPRPSCTMAAVDPSAATSSSGFSSDG